MARVPLSRNGVAELVCFEFLLLLLLMLALLGRALRGVRVVGTVAVAVLGVFWRRGGHGLRLWLVGDDGSGGLRLGWVAAARGGRGSGARGPRGVEGAVRRRGRLLGLGLELILGLLLRLRRRQRGAVCVVAVVIVIGVRGIAAAAKVHVASRVDDVADVGVNGRANRVGDGDAACARRGAGLAGSGEVVPGGRRGWWGRRRGRGWRRGRRGRLILLLLLRFSGVLVVVIVGVCIVGIHGD
jgi:hypothetical protein